MVVFNLSTIYALAKSLLYSFPLSPSSSGQGRHPFKVDIAGSNPAGAPFKLRSPLPRSDGLLLPICRDSNPEGIKSHCRPGALDKNSKYMSTVTNLVTAISCRQKTIWTQRRPTAEELQAFIS